MGTKEISFLILGMNLPKKLSALITVQKKKGIRALCSVNKGVTLPKGLETANALFS